MYSRWRHPPKTVSPRPYCRSRRGRNGLVSETNMMAEHHLYPMVNKPTLVTDNTDIVGNMYSDAMIATKTGKLELIKKNIF